MPIIAAADISLRWLMLSAITLFDAADIIIY